MKATIELDQALIDAAPIVAQTLKNGSVIKGCEVTSKMMTGDANLILHLLEKVGAARIVKSKDRQINQNSGDTEFWTPPAIVEEHAR